MAGDTLITIAGNLGADPVLTFTPSGVAKAAFRVGSTPRSFNKQSGDWTDGETLWLHCTAWRKTAENVAETLEKGMRVIVHGRLQQRSYEPREGGKRQVYEIEVDEVAPSLRNATARVKTARRQRGDQGGGDPDDQRGSSGGTPGPF